MDKIDETPGLRKGMGGHQSHAMLKDEWLTPSALLAKLGQFDLDPCAPISPPWQTAAKTYNIRDDGLKQPWSGRCWVNPPYGREAAANGGAPSVLIAYGRRNVDCLKSIASLVAFVALRAPGVGQPDLFTS